MKINELMELARKGAGLAEKDGVHCVQCGGRFEAGVNIFTSAGSREASISGLCEKCFDEAFAGEDEDRHQGPPIY